MGGVFGFWVIFYLFSSKATAETILSDNFDTYNLGELAGQSLWYVIAGDSFLVSDNYAKSSPQSFRGNPNYYSIMNRDLPRSIESGYVDFWISSGGFSTNPVARIYLCHTFACDTTAANMFFFWSS